MGIKRVFIDTNIIIYLFEKNDHFFTQVLPIFFTSGRKANRDCNINHILY